MKPMLLYPAVSTEAGRYAAEILHKKGISIIDHPAPEITHLLLDIPSFSADGSLRGGGDVERILERLPPSITVVGGNLRHPALKEYACVDFLRDESYLAQNAAITADCAFQVASPLLKTTFRDTPTLIIGWGRIGKCLAQMLKSIGAPVTVAARKEKDRAMLRCLGYGAVEIGPDFSGFRLIFNTVPEEVVSREITGCVIIDLASKREIPGNDVIWARGLPGTHAPESSGKLIAETFLRQCKEGKQ